MKKINLIFIIFSLVLILAACQKSIPTDDDGEDPNVLHEQDTLGDSADAMDSNTENNKPAAELKPIYAFDEIDMGMFSDGEKHFVEYAKTVLSELYPDDKFYFVGISNSGFDISKAGNFDYAPEGVMWLTLTSDNLIKLFLDNRNEGIYPDTDSKEKFLDSLWENRVVVTSEYPVTSIDSYSDKYLANGGSPYTFGMSVWVDESQPDRHFTHSVNDYAAKVRHMEIKDYWETQAKDAIAPLNAEVIYTKYESNGARESRLQESLENLFSRDSDQYERGTLDIEMIVYSDDHTAMRDAGERLREWVSTQESALNIEIQLYFLPTGEDISTIASRYEINTEINDRNSFENYSVIIGASSSFPEHYTARGNPFFISLEWDESTSSFVEKD